jgi:Dockerin type I domain
LFPKSKAIHSQAIYWPAYEVINTDADEGIDDLVIAVAAYKPTATGGLTLDTSFGDYNNDNLSTTPIGGGTQDDPAGVQGYSIVNPWALIYQSESWAYDGGNSFGVQPVGIAVDNSGRIDVLFSPGSGGNGFGILQLEPDGTETDPDTGLENTFGNVLGITSEGGDWGDNGAECWGSTVAANENWDISGAAAIAVNPETDNIVVASSYGPGSGYPSSAIFEFNSDGADAGAPVGSSELFFGTSSLTVGNSTVDTSNFSTITVDSTGNIYAATRISNGDIAVAKITSNGTLDTSFGNSGTSGWSVISSVSEEPEGGSLGSPFGIGLTSDGDIIVGAPVVYENHGFYYTDSILSTLDSSGDPSDAYVGQQYVSLYENGIYGYPPLQMQVNPDGDVALNAGSSYAVDGMWISGSNEQDLYEPYQNDAGYGSAIFYDDGVVLVGVNTPAPTDSNNPQLTLAAYGLTPESGAPSLLSAQSVFHQNGTDYGINVDVAVTSGAGAGTGEGQLSVEGRMTSQNSSSTLETLQLTFAQSISEGTDFSVSTANLLGGTDGTVYATSISGNVLSVELYNVNNMQTLVVTVNNVETGGANIADTYTLDLGVLWGDTNSDGTVNSVDYGYFAAGFGHSVNAGNFMADIDGNGVVNSVDYGWFAADFGKSLPSDEIP